MLTDLLALIAYQYEDGVRMSDLLWGYLSAGGTPGGLAEGALVQAVKSDMCEVNSTTERGVLWGAVARSDATMDRRIQESLATLRGLTGLPVGPGLDLALRATPALDSQTLDPQVDFATYAEVYQSRLPQSAKRVVSQGRKCEYSKSCLLQAPLLGVAADASAADDNHVAQELSALLASGSVQLMVGDACASVADAPQVWLDIHREFAATETFLRLFSLVRGKSD